MEKIKTGKLIIFLEIISYEFCSQRLQYNFHKLLRNSPVQNMFIKLHFCLLFNYINQSFPIVLLLSFSTLHDDSVRMYFGTS